MASRIYFKTRIEVKFCRYLPALRVCAKSGR
ncbi:hypothetical protein CH54_1749 [Yersinia rochesterensis]|uniref:Uncharacterized protein n=1 Tax=Yersinia rochesterensis TaxID=1604335 RepID=A0ABM5SLS8_9GAMM|nr:hypothetical protein DJ57_2670 [Yersinia rochesterensis]AJI86987.1 hypothetical protein AW19_4041 [Yersinia frederiksenii Y225]AJJ35383.1 hypothetical protein CH54_1749 [Yersinia rochesterensis]CNH20618.1 Uncharacterised protein [Yersinia kristensenii]CRY62854.1 Uncharacterised protein [Yersinia kristensenii]